MPNTFAYVALLGWPLIAAYLFATKKFERAIIWSVVGSFLFLPSSFAINLEGLPGLDKVSLPNATLLMIVIIIARKQFRILPQSRIATMLIILMVSGAFLTSMSNQDAIWIGRTLLPSLGPYDALSNVGQKLLVILPLLIGWQYLATAKAHREILQILLMAGLAYSLLALFEIRMSPQLHYWVYGYFPHDWSQTHRGGGFRPVVFFKHGLWLSFFIFTATLSAAALWRDAKKPDANNGETTYKANMRPLYLCATGYLAIVLVLCKSFGALIYGVVFVPLVVFTKPQARLRIAVILALISMAYPALRGADLVPVNKAVEFAKAFSTERAASLSSRIENEDRLLRHAQERPLFGWGAWGRNRVYDEATGKDITLTDGYWIVVIGKSGWVGYISSIGLLGFSILAVWRRSRRVGFEGLQMGTSALCLLLGINMIEILPNSTLPPWTWLIAGALLGYAGKSNRVGTDQPTKVTVDHQYSSS